MNEFIVFRKYPTRENAMTTLRLLSEHNIAYECDDNMDSYFRIELGSLESLKGMYLKLLAKDFEKAKAILKDEANEWIGKLSKDYYLFAFSDTELLEIVRKPDEWNEVDYELAKKILAERGIPIEESAEKKMYNQRLEELSKPISASMTIIITTAFFILGFYGLIMAWQLYKSKKVLPSGQTVYIYDENSRWMGKILLTAAPFIYFIYFVMMYHVYYP
jgi:hypothetical protein